MTRVTARLLLAISVTLLSAAVGAGPLATGGGYLGIAMSATEEGVRIVQVLPDSPAATAGLQAGDVIRTLDGAAVNDLSQIVDGIQNQTPATRVVVSVTRDGVPLDIEVTLSERPPMLFPPGMHGPRGPMAALHHCPFPRVQMGVQLQSLTPGLRNYFRVPEAQGVLVADVVPGSPAAAAGIEAGDVILAVADTPVASPSDVIAQIRDREPLERVIVRVIRGGSERDLEVQLAERPIGPGHRPFLDPEDDGSPGLPYPLPAVPQRLRERPRAGGPGIAM